MRLVERGAADVEAARGEPGREIAGDVLAGGMQQGAAAGIDARRDQIGQCRDIATRESTWSKLCLRASAAVASPTAQTARSRRSANFTARESQTPADSATPRKPRRQ